MSDIKKICKDCHISKGIHRFPLVGSNYDGRSHVCDACLYEKKKPGKAARKKEKDFWAQFSPI